MGGASAFASPGGCSCNAPAGLGAAIESEPPVAQTVPDWGVELGQDPASWLSRKPAASPLRLQVISGQHSPRNSGLGGCIGAGGAAAGANVPRPVLRASLDHPGLGVDSRSPRST